jgi:hypothetical protein
MTTLAPAQEATAVGFALTTSLACSAQALWFAISHMDQINYELAPYLAMTAPARAREQSIEDLALGELAFVSVILLFKVLPIDLHFLKLQERREGVGFVESSSSLANALWRHERFISASTPDAASCSITDRISFRSRIRGFDRLILPLVRALFAHRHRKLLARFGAAGTAATDAAAMSHLERPKAS